MTARKPCSNGTPSWFTGHWRDWHRGHGCDQDDGKDRSNAAVIEIEQHRKRAATGFLTDAELGLLHARTTSGDDLLVRALAELTARRATEDLEALVRRSLGKQWWYSPQMPIDEVIIRASERLRHDHEEKCSTVVELLRDARAKLAAVEHVERSSSPRNTVLVDRSQVKVLNFGGTAARAIPTQERVRFMLAHGEELALFVKCSNKACAAEKGQPCTPYTHFIRVRDAINAGHLDELINRVDESVIDEKVDRGS